MFVGQLILTQSTSHAHTHCSPQPSFLPVSTQRRTSCCLCGRTRSWTPRLCRVTWLGGGSKFSLGLQAKLPATRPTPHGMQNVSQIIACKSSHQNLAQNDAAIDCRSAESLTAARGPNGAWSVHTRIANKISVASPRASPSLLYNLLLAICYYRTGRLSPLTAACGGNGAWSYDKNGHEHKPQPRRRAYLLIHCVNLPNISGRPRTSDTARISNPLCNLL